MTLHNITNEKCNNVDRKQTFYANKTLYQIISYFMTLCRHPFEDIVGKVSLANNDQIK